MNKLQRIYSRDELRKMAYLASRASYWETENGARLFLEDRGLDVKVAALLSYGPTQCLIAYKSDVIIIAFRGTESSDLADWIVNLKADLVNWSGPGKVHHGYRDSALNMYAHIMKTLNGIRNLLKLDPPLLICGHSAGGGIAMTTTALFAHAGITDNVGFLCTFGCPRVGDPEFAKWHDSLFGEVHDRFVNNNDVVPRIPGPSGIIMKVLTKCIPYLWMLPFGYRHSGVMQYINVSGKVIENPSRFILFKDRLAGRILDLGIKGTDGLTDHYIDQTAYGKIF